MKLRQNIVHSVCGRVGIVGIVATSNLGVGIVKHQSFKGPSHFMQYLTIYLNRIFKSVSERLGNVQHQIWEWVLWNINECIKGPSHWRTSPPPPCIQPSKLPKEPHIHTKHFQIWQTNIAGGSLVKPENCTWSDWIYMSLGYIWLVNFEHNWMFSCNWPFRFCREPQMENMRRNQFSDIETKTSGQIYSKK